jgi:hypothetical protein
VEWAKRSIDFAFSAGAGTCVVIPVRAGNGAMEALAEKGYFAEPTINSLEEVLSYGIGLKAGRVLADVWDLENFSGCKRCFHLRLHRLNQMNLLQTDIPGISCSC